MTTPSAASASSFDEVVLGRRSIRGFTPEPVPKALIKEIIEIAMRAPSSLNTQPWNFYVVAGAPLDRIRAGNTERNLAGVPSSREFRGHGEYAGAHRERQIEIAKQLFGAMGIERTTREAQGLGAARLSPVRRAGLGRRHLRPLDPRRRHRPLRLRRGDQRPGQRRLVARAWAA